MFVDLAINKQIPTELQADELSFPLNDLKKLRPKNTHQGLKKPLSSSQIITVVLMGSTYFSWY